MSVDAWSFHRLLIQNSKMTIRKIHFSTEGQRHLAGHIITHHPAVMLITTALPSPRHAVIGTYYYVE
jgi:hypothetical protein